MLTLHPGLRVGDLASSLDFYRAVGFEEVGRVPLPDETTLVCLKLPDDPFVSLELVDEPAARPVQIGNGLSHIAVQVDDLAGESEPVNLPATSTEHPNWRRRQSLTLEELAASPALKTTAAMLAQSRARPES